jgi:pimeloyl-ACP methyl ester carboxylesterase
MKKNQVNLTSIMVVFFFIILSWSNLKAMDFIFKDTQYSFQALRTVTSIPGGAADIGESLKTLYRIKEGDDESWYREWRTTAEEREKAAEKFLAGGYKLSAKKEYFRASNYYRTAEFFLHNNPKDPRILRIWSKSRECFIKAAGLSETPIKPVEIPFEGITLPGYLCLVDNSGERRPLLIIHTGFDGTAEELYFQQAYAALERGYNCLLFEGPGQGRVIREQKIPFRPNWETVVTPVVNFALKQPEVDPNRIALMGISLGGYLAPRAAAFENRIKVCITNGGVYNFHTVMRLTEEEEKSLDTKEGSEEIDKSLYIEMKKNPSLRWSIGNGMFTFQAASPSEWLRMTRAYTMKGIADKIRCHMLVVDSEEDKDMPGQAIQLYNALTCPKDFMLFTKKEGAEEHCQIGANVISNERILDWLDDTMKLKN